MTSCDGPRARATSFGRLAEGRTDEELRVEHQMALLAAAWAPTERIPTTALPLKVRAERA